MGNLYFKIKNSIKCYTVVCFLFFLSCKNEKSPNKEITEDNTTSKTANIDLETGLVYNLSLRSTDKLATSGGIFVDGRKGVAQDAISLNGTNEYVLIKNKVELNPEEEITISIWYKPVSFKGIGNNAIINKGFEIHKPPFHQYHLGVTGNEFENKDKSTFTFTLALDDIGVNLKTPSNFWKPNNWYHIVATYDGKNVVLYVNGAQVATKKYDGGIIHNYEKDLCIGKFSNINKYTPGVYDDFKIYNRALSKEEISGLYKQ